MPAKIRCPTCGRPVAWTPQSPFRPFCSERCKLIDLGEWLTDGYRIPDPGDSPSDDPPSAEEARPIH